MAAGSQIDDQDYNSLQDRAQLLLGSGSGSRGYGQVLQTGDVFVGNIVTAAQWNLLRDDILSIRTHQDGSAPFVIQVVRGSPINYNVIPNYDTLLSVADANRFNIGAGQSVVSTSATTSTSSSWTSQAQAVLTVTFSNSNQGRYFFNSGGKIRFVGNRSGGSATSQNNAWTNILSNIGTVSFGAAAQPSVNYYNLTNSYQTYYLQNLSTPYSSNSIRLEAMCNVSNNVNGTATQVMIRITLRDDYVDPSPGNPPAPGDLVDGTLSFTIEELKASGSLFPTGTWNIVSPTYSLSAITVA